MGAACHGGAGRAFAPSTHTVCRLRASTSVECDLDSAAVARTPLAWCAHCDPVSKIARDEHEVESAGGARGALTSCAVGGDAMAPVGKLRRPRVGACTTAGSCQPSNRSTNSGSTSWFSTSLVVVVIPSSHPPRSPPEVVAADEFDGRVSRGATGRPRNDT